jgi:hypothetical protein
MAFLIYAILRHETHDNLRNGPKVSGGSFGMKAYIFIYMCVSSGR